MVDHERAREGADLWTARGRSGRRERDAIGPRLTRYALGALLFAGGCGLPCLVSHFWPPRPPDVAYELAPTLLVVLAVQALTHNLRIAAGVFTACWLVAFAMVITPPLETPDWLWLGVFAVFGGLEIAMLQRISERGDGASASIRDD